LLGSTAFIEGTTMASCLTLSGIPTAIFIMPYACVRLLRIDTSMVVSPSGQQQKNRE